MTFRTKIMKQIHHEELTGIQGEINLVALAASMADEDTMKDEVSTHHK